MGSMILFVQELYGLKLAGNLIRFLSQLSTTRLHFHGTHGVLLWPVQELYAAKVAGNLNRSPSQLGTKKNFLGFITVQVGCTQPAEGTDQVSCHLDTTLLLCRPAVISVSS